MRAVESTSGRVRGQARKRLPATALAVVLCALGNQLAWTQDPTRQPAETAADNPGAPDAENLEARIARALELGLPIVRKAAANYPEHRNCFSCHHQTLPMLAVVTAGPSPQAGDDALLKAQAQFTHKSFEKQIDELRRGEGIGGRALTVSYGLWALSLGRCKADETTAAMIAYLVKTQHEDGHWDVHTSRPPMEDSWETSTALSIAGLKHYATPEGNESEQAALAKAKTWLAGRVPKTQEDKVFRLWALHLLSASREVLDPARAAALAKQRDDGGWAQIDSMESDAYATGQTLWVLHATGLADAGPAFRRGIVYLLKSQLADGSWFVETRSKAIQVYFDNGDPHGTDQFISTPATCWALAALAGSRKPACADNVPVK